MIMNEVVLKKPWSAMCNEANSGVKGLPSKWKESMHLLQVTCI